MIADYRVDPVEILRAIADTLKANRFHIGLIDLRTVTLFELKNA